jgi:hypothetical protein
MTSVIDGSERLATSTASILRERASGTQWVSDFVLPRARLAALEKREIVFTNKESNLGLRKLQLVA